jgi:hypothetical protein
MSNSREMMNLGTTTYYQPYCDTITTHVIYAGRAVINEVEPAGPQIHLAPNHQEFTPPHKKNRRGKHKRSGR